MRNSSETETKEKLPCVIAPNSKKKIWFNGKNLFEKREREREREREKSQKIFFCVFQVLKIQERNWEKTSFFVFTKIIFLNPKSCFPQRIFKDEKKKNWCFHWWKFEMFENFIECWFFSENLRNLLALSSQISIFSRESLKKILSVCSVSWVSFQHQRHWNRNQF